MKTAIGTETNKFEKGPPEEPVMRAEQRHFEEQCFQYGFKPHHYLKKAYVWSTIVEDYVEASLVAFTEDGRAKFAYSLENDLYEYDLRYRELKHSDLSPKRKRQMLSALKPKEHYAYLSIKQASLFIKSYAEDLWDRMIDGTFPKDRYMLNILRDDVSEMESLLKNKYGYIEGKYPDVDQLITNVNLYGNYANARISLPK